MKRGRARGAALLTADALIFLAAAYLAVRSDLLLRDGVIDPARAALVGVPCLVVLAALAFAVPRLLGQRRSWKVTLLELLALGAFVGFPGWASGLPPRKAESYLWVAQEWTRIPENFGLLFSLFPGLVLVIPLLVGATAALAARDDLGRERAVGPLVVAAAAMALVYGMDAGFHRGIVYWIVYVLPWLLAAAGFLAKRTRLATRAAAMGAATATLLIPYVGLLPVGRADFAAEPGVRRIYPVGDARSE